MSVAFGGGGKGTFRSLVAGLALGLVAGCGEPGENPARPDTKAPPNPAPRADLGVTVEPRLRDTDQPGATREVSKVEKDLKKDLGVPVIIKPGTAAPPAGKPAAVGTGTP